MMRSLGWVGGRGESCFGEVVFEFGSRNFRNRSKIRGVERIGERIFVGEIVVK